jgi:hypothetical protein
MGSQKKEENKSKSEKSRATKKYKKSHLKNDGQNQHVLGGILGDLMLND